MITSDLALTLALVILAAVLVAFIIGYNGLVRARNRVREGWSSIDVQLRRRASLVPNLVEAVRGYAAHERGVFDEVSQARSVLQQARRAGEVDLATPVTMTRNATKQAFLESGLTLGRTMTLEDALFAMLTASANDVAVALAEAVVPDGKAFVQRMNDAAARLGMTGTHFSNPNGLFDKTNYTTARDLALLGLEVDRAFPEYSRFFQAAAVTIDGKTTRVPLRVERVSGGDGTGGFFGGEDREP